MSTKYFGLALCCAAAVAAQTPQDSSKPQQAQSVKALLGVVQKPAEQTQTPANQPDAKNGDPKASTNTDKVLPMPGISGNSTAPQASGTTSDDTDAKNAKALESPGVKVDVQPKSAALDPQKQAELQSIAENATLSVFTYDYKNADLQMKKASSYFTTEGWNAFYRALDHTGNLVHVKQEHLSVTAKLDGKVSLLKADPQGTYWEFRIPVLVNYKSADQDQNITQHLTVDVTLVPVPGLTRTPSVAVTRFLAKGRQT